MNVRQMRVNIDVTSVTCVDSRYDAYELTSTMLQLNRLGRVIPQTDLAEERLPLVWDDGALTLDGSPNVILVFDTPVGHVKAKGKAAERF